LGGILEERSSEGLDIMIDSSLVRRA
jgi:hypothetical protein